MDMDLVQQDDEEDKEDRGGGVVNKRQFADRARLAGLDRRRTFSNLLIFKYSPLCVFWCYFAIPG